MKVRFLVVVLITLVAFGLVSAQRAEALTVTAYWSGCVAGTFSLNLMDEVSPANVFIVSGKLYSGLQLPVTGTAVLDTTFNVYRLSLFSTSAVGETLTFGMEIDPVTLIGTGYEQRIAHGSVDSDCVGSLSGIIIQ